MRGTTQALALAMLIALGVAACAEQADQEGTAGEMEMSMAMDPMELRSAIESNGDAWESAANAGDATALAELYATDATLMPDGAETVRGRDGIQEFWTGFLAEIPEGSVVELESVDVDGAGDLAYEVGRFTLSSGGDVLDEGKFVVVWQHQPDGSWKMLVDIWNRNESMEM